MPMGIEAIVGVVANQRIIEINLENNALGPDGLKCLEAFMQVTKSFEVLRVTNCALGDKSAQIILGAHQKNPEFRLKKLEAGSNKFGEEGMKALNQACRQMGSLTHIHLQGSLENDDNALLYLLSSLHECSLLRYLDISNNNGANLATPAIIDFFTHTGSLCHLNISNLCLTADNQSAIINGLTTKLSTSFNLTSNLQMLICTDTFST